MKLVGEPTKFLSYSIYFTLLICSIAWSDGQQFIRDLKAVYLTEEAKKDSIIGIELELTGLTVKKVQTIVQSRLQGRIEGEFLKNTLIGDIRIYWDGTLWRYRDWAQDENHGRENVLRRAWYSLKDAFQGTTEVAFPPIPFEQIAIVEDIVAALAEAGADGTKGFAAASFQVNKQIDPKNHKVLQNIYSNYTNNGELFREYFMPSWIRRMSGYLKNPSQKLRNLLGDFFYRPTPEEFWRDFREGAHIKLSRINIGPALLENLDIEPEEKRVLLEEGWANRPAFEMREANAVFRRGHVTDLAEIAIALHEASEKTGHVNSTDLRVMASSGRSEIAFKTRVDFSMTKRTSGKHSLTEVVDSSNYVGIPLKENPKAQTAFIDLDHLKDLGLANPNVDLNALKAEHAKSFGYEVVRPGEEPPSEKVEGQVLALAYDDGYLGRGDGRAGLIGEKSILGKGVFDIGEKGGGLTIYGIPQESIDKGFHIGEKDGYLSYEEAILVLFKSKMLQALSIDSEVILSILPTGKVTGFNINPPNIQPTVKVVRAFDNALRGAHLTKYNDIEMKRVSQWLRQREAVRLGLKNTDMVPAQIYVENKVRRDAMRAAVAQHFWIVHGAINIANLFENGWADVMYVEALPVPDGRYTPLNVYSRLEYQAREFFKVTSQFVGRIQAVEPNVKVNVNNLFWQTYESELTRLELISFGLTSEEAESLMKHTPELAAEYRQSVWSLNYGAFRTDTRQLKRVIGLLHQKYPEEASNPDSSRIRQLRMIAERVTSWEPQEVLVEEMPFLKDRIQYRLKKFFDSLTGHEADRNRSASDTEIFRFSELTGQIMRNVSTLTGRTLSQVRSSVARRAAIAASVDFPQQSEMATMYQELLKSGIGTDLNSFLNDYFERTRGIKKTVQSVYGELSPSKRVAQEVISRMSTGSKNSKQPEIEQTKLTRSGGPCAPLIK